MAPPTTDPVERLLKFVEFSEGGCWLWTGHTNHLGYGHWSVPGESTRQAHRLVWIVLVGPIPEGMQLDHLCRVRRCVNPDHLEPVTPQINTLRGNGLAAKNARKERCNHGHPLRGENLYVTPDGRRNCRPCRREQQRRYRERQAVAV